MNADKAGKDPPMDTMGRIRKCKVTSFHPEYPAHLWTPLF
jgi:hypothetical protein